MILSSTWLNHSEPNPQNSPVIVFLHGFLGSAVDWQPIIEYLERVDCLAIDLAGHGQSSKVEPKDFITVCHQVAETLETRISKNRPVVLVGYSLGARVAMYGVANSIWSKINIVKVILEGGHFGLQSESDRKKRWVNDKNWSHRFSSETIEQVLLDWYRQPVFSSLNHEQRQYFIAKRRDNDAKGVAQMLRATSLSKQPYLLARLQNRTSIHYVCGERDQKFKALAESSGLPFSEVKGAGHNVHQEQPAAFAQIVNQCMAEHQYQS